MSLNTPLRRVLYESPLRTVSGKIALVVVFAVLFVAALPALGRYYFQAPLQMLAALPVMVLVYVPSLLILWYLDRREREPKLFFFGAILLVVFFLGPVTSQMLKYSTAMGLPTVRIVGFIEDFWKVVPLLLLIVFARASVNGVRDGLIYGALGGFGFSVLEGAAYFAMVFYPKDGWASFYNTYTRGNFLFTDQHIIWSAVVGAGLGYWVVSKRPVLRWLAPLGAFALVVGTHFLQDGVIGKTLAISGAIVGSPILSALGIDVNTLAQGSVPSTFLAWLGGTISLLVLDLACLIVLWLVIRRSGDTERRIIRERLTDEDSAVVTSEELAGAQAETRWHLRHIDGYDRTTARAIVRLQNELAVRKEFLADRGADAFTDPPAMQIRAEIAALRTQS
jgi:RsiW-degrading membrane proteinase PrsW (M82 family)